MANGVGSGSGDPAWCQAVAGAGGGRGGPGRRLRGTQKGGGAGNRRRRRRASRGGARRRRRGERLVTVPGDDPGLRERAAAAWRFRCGVEREARRPLRAPCRLAGRIGFPGLLVDMALRASSDEQRHAVRCAELMEGYGASAAGLPPAAPAVLAPAGLAPRATVLYEAVAACCVTETGSVGVLTTLLGSVRGGRLRRALRELAADEVCTAGWAGPSWRASGSGERPPSSGRGSRPCWREHRGEPVPARRSGGRGRGVARPRGAPSLPQERSVHPDHARGGVPRARSGRCGHGPARRWLEEGRRGGWGGALTRGQVAFGSAASPLRSGWADMEGPRGAGRRLGRPSTGLNRRSGAGPRDQGS